MDRIGVIGGGTMGAGIAEVVARAGHPVFILETSEQAADSARARLDKSLARAVRSGRLEAADADAARERVQVTLDIEDLADRDLVIEAAPEIEQLKVDIFTRLDQVVKPSAILASNTSSIPVIKMAKATNRPGQVVGVHFFNPVPILPLVEIVSSFETTELTAQTVTDFVRNRLGKKTIRSGDRAGFVVNALLIPYLVSAIRMFESGFAEAEDIDEGMVSGCAYPMGPLRLSDNIGLDVILAISESLYEEFREPHLAPPPLLRRMVDAGRLGKKSGTGFYSYS